jgi:hypothetical protein
MPAVFVALGIGWLLGRMHRSLVIGYRPRQQTCMFTQPRKLRGAASGTRALLLLLGRSFVTVSAGMASFEFL